MMSHWILSLINNAEHHLHIGIVLMVGFRPAFTLLSSTQQLG